MRINGGLNLMEHKAKLPPAADVLFRGVGTPRGKITRLANQLVSQQGHKEFAIEPCPGTLVIIFGQVAQPSQAFQALKDQFNLPAQSVPVQHLADWKLRGRPIRKNENILGIFEGFRLELTAIATGSPL